MWYKTSGCFAQHTSITLYSAQAIFCPSDKKLFTSQDVSSLVAYWGRTLYMVIGLQGFGLHTCKVRARGATVFARGKP
jgi:hypothetical protein